MVIQLVDEWATHFHFEGLTLYFLNYHLTIFQAKWRVHEDDYGKVRLRNLKVHFFHVHFLNQKVHQLKIRHTCTFFAYYYYYYYTCPQSEGNWERAKWPTPKRVVDPAPTSAPSVRNPLWLSCGCRPKWIHIPCYKPWLNKKKPYCGVFKMGFFISSYGEDIIIIFIIIIIIIILSFILSFSFFFFPFQFCDVAEVAIIHPWRFS